MDCNCLWCKNSLTRFSLPSRDPRYLMKKLYGCPACGYLFIEELLIVMRFPNRERSITSSFRCLEGSSYAEVISAYELIFPRFIIKGEAGKGKKAMKRIMRKMWGQIILPPVVTFALTGEVIPEGL